MPINTKLVLPVALGLSLVSVTAFVVYYVFKKEKEDEDEEKLDNKIKNTKVHTIEVQVPKTVVAALIGRGGCNIKDIERKTGAHINFKKFSDKDYDVCIIRGRSDVAQIAESLIHEFLKQQPQLIDDTMEVPGWACGRIIGTGGQNINEISHRSGARIKIEGSSADKSAVRNVSLRGSKDQIAQAKSFIENFIAQEKCRREIEQAKTPRVASTPTSPAASPLPPASSTTPTTATTATATTNEPEEQGDARQKHVIYKRPETVASIEVYVSAVSTPSRFWVQFVGAQVNQLDELVTEMTEYYSNKDNRAMHTLQSVSVGQVVAAVFRHDGRWYRARVQDICPNDFDGTKQVADVFYLDYGDSEFVALHELCELRADLLGLRFQAMECFLAGVRPAGAEADTVRVSPQGQRWEKWHPQAVERFEELTQVARWKPLISKTCTYKKSISAEGEKEKEIPGIKLYQITDEGELDIGATLVQEGWALRGARDTPSPPPRRAPFGDLGNSRVLGMLNEGRSTSLPKDHRNDEPVTPITDKDDVVTAAKSLTGLETADKLLSISNFDLSPPETQTNGSQNDFLHNERHNLDKEASPETPVSKIVREELKANMNRIDSHHSNLELLGRTNEQK